MHVKIVRCVLLSNIGFTTNSHLLIYYSSKMYYFLCSHDGFCFSFWSHQIPLCILHNVYLLVMNYFSLFLSWSLFLLWFWRITLTQIARKFGNISVLAFEMCCWPLGLSRCISFYRWLGASFLNLYKQWFALNFWHFHRSITWIDSV